MKINDANKMRLRPTMEVKCGVDRQGTTPTVSASARYGDGTYDANAKAREQGVVICLMDLCNGGFANDGKAEPISTESLGQHTKYGYIAKTPTGSNGKTPASSLAITLGESATVTVHAYDSTGKYYKFKKTGSSLDFSNDVIDANERLYIDRIVVGDSWQFDNSTLLSCILNLRGVETKVDNPSLQMSEIEIEALTTEVDDEFDSISENAPIWYTAGYPNDMSPVRKFYLTEPIQKELRKATIRGGDTVKFLEGEHYGVFSRYTNNVHRGNVLSAWARRVYGILGKGLTDDNNISFDYYNYLKKTATSDESETLFSWDGNSRRNIVSDNSNCMHSPTGGYGSSGVYLDFVDAGLPTLYAGTVPIGKHYGTNAATKRGYTGAWAVTDDEIGDVKREIEEPAETIDVNIFRAKYKTKKGKVVWQTFYAEPVEGSTNVPIAVEEPHTSATKKSSKQKGTIKNVYGHYYPDKDDYGKSCFHWVLKPKNDYDKFRIKGKSVKIIQLDSLSGTGIDPNLNYNGERLRIKTGKKGKNVNLTDSYNPLKQIISGSTVQSFWCHSLRAMKNRSLVMYSFTYRGNPMMQPRDIINVNGEPMTIESLTLEHTDGGLKSQIVCRKGIV